MRKIVLSSVLTLLASVSLLLAATQSADAQVAGQLARGGRVVQWQGSHLLALVRGGCACPRQRPRQRQVVPPQIWLDSYSIKPGQTFGFGGRGFQPGERVDIRLGDLEDVPSKSKSRLLVAAFANAGGNVNGEASIPFMPAGDYPLIAVGHENQEMLVRNLTVLGFAPWVVLDNYAPPPSTQFGFKGQGFAPGEPVLVYFDQQTGQQVTRLTADRDGEFAVYQGVESPAQPGDHALILVGVYSGAVVKVNFEILPPASAPAPPPTNGPLAASAPAASRLSASSTARAAPAPAAGSTARAAPAPAASRRGALGLSAPLNGALGASGLGGALGALSLQNPAMLVLLVLLLWVLLCLFLVLLLLFAPLVHKRPFGRRASLKTALRAGGQSEGAPQAPLSVASTTGVISPALLPSQDQAHQPARFCPRCGVRNISRASRCAVCGGELPQMAGAAAGAKEQERSRLALRFSAKADRGRKRAGDENEDSFLAVTGARRSKDRVEPFGLFVVADGMGGHGDGHKASGTAVESLFHALVPSLLHEEWAEHDLLPLLSQAIQGVNERLYQTNQCDQTRMGCTLTAALVTGREAHICNVGDSRTYLLGTLAPLRRVTVDHSLVESLVVAGIIQRAEVYTHPKRNQIFRCLGHQPWVEVDTFRQPLAHGEMLLLCSDGLWEMVRDPEMEAILRQMRDVTDASSRLVARANENGGLDNIAVIVVACTNEALSLTQPGLLSLSSTQPGLLVSST